MKTVCSWCGALIRHEDGTRGPDSHGICQGCAVKAKAEINQTKAVQRDGEERQVVNPMKSE
jgi:hypothetical protein